MRDRLAEVLKKCGADYAEIRFETEDWTSLGFRGKEFDRIRSGIQGRGMVRACVRGGWGVATFETVEAMEQSVQEAHACAVLAGSEKTELAGIVPHVSERPAHWTRDFRGIPLDEKIKLCAGYNQIILRHDPAIASSGVGYEESFRTVYFLNSRGTYFMEERPRVTLSFHAMARSGSLTQRSGDSFSSTHDFRTVLNREKTVEENARRAVELLKAPQCPGGARTAILDPEIGGVFIHEAFGHLSEADFLHENPKLKALMHPGRKIGVSELNVIDDGSRDQLLGTRGFDDEGTPTATTYLIKEGILAGYLHSLETAAKMKGHPTGNARAVDTRHPPIVRMTNTYIEPGKSSFQELIRDIPDGIYALGAVGGQTEFEMFTFSAKYGYRIRNGQVAELIRDVVMTGNVFETLHRMDGFAADLAFTESGGGCGKGRQYPLPVSFGAPHVRIREVVFGGEA